LCAEAAFFAAAVLLRGLVFDGFAFADNASPRWNWNDSSALAEGKDYKAFSFPPPNPMNQECDLRSRGGI
jgi:hypothetical protein